MGCIWVKLQTRCGLNKTEVYLFLLTQKPGGRRFQNAMELCKSFCPSSVIFSNELFPFGPAWLLELQLSPLRAVYIGPQEAEG